VPDVPRPQDDDRDAGSTAVTAGRGAIDWEDAGRRALRARAAAPTRRSDCDDAPPPGSMRPRCTPRTTPFEWRPQPRAVEFDGLIPYVHLGKRCVLGLGFFGCAVGALPGANGRLFEGMRAPDRARSSVPDDPPGGDR
jgi:hypothetical protein